MNVVKEIERINEEELKLGIYGGISKGSWHSKYKDTAWVFLGGFSYELSEGDIICVMSQWGEIEDINLVREKSTNKSMGFAFIKYEDFRSTILAVDNFNGIKLLGRTLRCDHVEKYKLPKEIRQKEEERLEINPEASVDIGPGHAYQDKELENEFNIKKGVKVWGEAEEDKDNEDNRSQSNKEKVSKKHKKEKKKSEKAKKSHSSGKESNHDKSSRSKRDRSSESFTVPPPQPPVFTTTSNSSFNNSSTFPPSDEAPICSWRGVRDPTVASALATAKKYAAIVDESDKPLKRDEFAGMGGMKRIR